MMATLDNVLSGVAGNLRNLSASVGAAPLWVVGLTGVPFLLAAGTYAFGSIGLGSMEPATATALFNGATGVGSFATMLLVSRMLEDVGGSFHFAEVLPSILAVGLAGVGAAYVFTPPNLQRFLGPAWDQATKAANLTGGA